MDYGIWRKPKSAPIMRKYHRQHRNKWAFDQKDAAYIELGFYGSRNENFNLNGPNGNAFHYLALRTDEGIFSKRSHGDGSMMFWASFPTQIGAHFRSWSVGRVRNATFS